MAHVLFIEPDRVLASTYCLAAGAAGYSACSAATAQGGLFAADNTQPDLVVLELQLVAHSGIEFLYEFHSYSDWRDIPVIINSTVPPTEFTSCWELLKNNLKVQAYFYKPQTDLRSLLRGIADAIAPKLLV